MTKSKNSNRTRSQPPGEIFFGADRPGLPYHIQLKGVAKTLGFDVCVVAHPGLFFSSSSHSHRWMQMLRLAIHRLVT